MRFRLRKFFKYFLYFILFVIASFVLGYFIPRKWNYKQKTGDVVTIYVENTGVHCDIIVPVKNEIMDWMQNISLDEIGNGSSHDYGFLAFGWGEKNFYLNVPEWKDLTFSIAFRAMCLPTSSLMHVSGYFYIEKNEDLKSVSISKSDYKKLVQFINDSFKTEANGNKIKIAKGYDANDSFFDAKGSYHFFNNCNSWTAQALRIADVNTPLWAFFASSIMYHLPAKANAKEGLLNKK